MVKDDPVVWKPCPMALMSVPVIQSGGGVGCHTGGDARGNRGGGWY